MKLNILVLLLCFGVVGCVPAKSSVKKTDKKPAAEAKKTDAKKTDSKKAEAKKEAPAAAVEEAPQKSSGSPLRAEIKIGTDISSLEPSGVAKSFSSDTLQVVGWSRITGASEPTEIVHIWSLKGAEQSRVTLPVKSSSFRTYSRKSVIGQKGKWMLTIKDSQGRTLGSQEFEVK